MKLLIVLSLVTIFTTNVFAQTSNSKDSKYQLDKKAIKEMVGCYKVTFEFAETFSPDTSYQYHDRKFDWGIEYIFVVEETESKIALQHILVVNDTFIVKHWRQDWIFENREVLAYYKDNEWRKVTLTPEQAKGTWTQKVFQVDDSPRYESYGTWNHVDNRHFWEGVADSPLPRREIKKRSDYNVLKRHSTIEITTYGWILEQDNEKINRTENGDQLICWEKGFEKFHKGTFNCQPAIEYWEKNDKYWADVRASWTTLISNSKVLNLQTIVDNKFLFEQLFAAGASFEKSDRYNSKEAKLMIDNIITSYIKN